MDEAALARLGAAIGTGACRELVDIFLKELPRRRAEVAAAVEAGDARRIGFAAHAIKSSARLVGCPDLAERCRAVEEAGYEGRLDDAVRDVPGLLAAAAIAEEALRSWDPRR